LTLIQTGIIKDFPVVLIGKSYYKPLRDMLEKMVDAKTIAEKDLNLLLITDDMKEVEEYIQNYLLKNYVIKRVKPSRFFRDKLSNRAKFSKKQ
jgi:predicted Rossmann-fold nucleotide-binding protein